jgi:hypothetical protein
MRTPRRLGAVALVLGGMVTAQGCAAIIGADFGDDPVLLDAGGATGAPDAGVDAQPDAEGTAGGDAQDAAELDAGGCGTIDASPAVLLSSSASPQFLALGSGDLYVTTGATGSLFSCALPSGCGATPSVLFSGKDVYGIAIDNQNAYATDYITGDLLVCTLAGCANSPQAYGPNIASNNFGGGVRLAGSSVLWVDVGHVYAAPLSNLSSYKAIATGSSVDDVAFAPAYLGGTVFWTDTGAGTISSCQLSSCGTTTKVLVSNQLSPAYLAVDSNHLYWTDADSNNGSIVQVNLDGSAATTLASSQPSPWGIAVDSKCVYWADYIAGGSVKRCAIGGCNATPSLVAGNQQRPKGVAVDGAYVYWSVESEGTVKKLPK